MAVSHISYTKTSPHGHLLAKALDDLRGGFNGLNLIFNTFNMMKDGDGSQASHFVYAADKFGFPDTTTAKAAYDELNSLQSKLNTNSSISDLNAAMLQAFHKFG